VKIDHWKKKGNEDAFMVEVTVREALSLIQSLSVQIQHRDPNRGRYESSNATYVKPSRKESPAYFSIAVQPDPLCTPPNVWKLIMEIAMAVPAVPKSSKIRQLLGRIIAMGPTGEEAKKR
jgi:hypothetical protein